MGQSVNIKKTTQGSFLFINIHGLVFAQYLFSGYVKFVFWFQKVHFTLTAPSITCILYTDTLP